MSGLFRRGAFWWARLVVPTKLCIAAGRREFIQSTRTTEKVVAKLIAATLLNHTGFRGGSTPERIES